MSKDIECPYCGHEQDICHDDGHGYDEGYAHEEVCHECEKTFVFYTSISFRYKPEKSPCLNGGDEHDMSTTSFRGQLGTFKVCSHCGYEVKETT